jgi:hypothetical protein
VQAAQVRGLEAGILVLPVQAVDYLLNTFKMFAFTMLDNFADVQASFVDSENAKYAHTLAFSDAYVLFLPHHHGPFVLDR